MYNKEHKKLGEMENRMVVFIDYLYQGCWLAFPVNYLTLKPQNCSIVFWWSIVIILYYTGKQFTKDLS